VTDETTYKRRIFEANRMIFDEGDPADIVYILSSGAVEIRVDTLTDYPRVLTRINVGDVFGELALLEGRSHQAAAIATRKSEVLEVTREEFLDRLNAADPVMKAVVNHLVSSLRTTARELKKSAAQI